jgi:hypothetical protein
MIGAILDSTRVDFGVLEFNDTTVRLVARSNERMRDVSTAVRICTCPSNPDHIYLESDLNGSHTCSDSQTSRRLRTNIILTPLTFGENIAPVVLTISENVLTFG